MSEIVIMHEQPPCKKEQLRNHIYEIQDILVPPLTGRVDIEDYINKLSEHANLFYAMEGNIVCGSCAVYLNQPIAFISSIDVLPNYWRKGVGSRLIEEVIRVARKLKKTDILLKVSKTNHKAISFYKKCGFESRAEESEWLTMGKKLEG